MTIFKRISILFVFLLCGFIHEAKSQDGSISGTVLSNESSKPLPDVNIQFQNLNRGFATNNDGKYEITKLKPGSYTLVFSYIGFQKAYVDLQVVAGEQKKVNVNLQPKPVELSGIQVTALPPSLSVSANMQESEVRKPTLGTRENSSVIFRASMRSAADRWDLIL